MFVEEFLAGDPTTLARILGKMAEMMNDRDRPSGRR
jgi:hypothetical protein